MSFTSNAVSGKHIWQPEYLAAGDARLHGSRNSNTPDGIRNLVRGA
jgi:hypothetical protein